MKMLRIGSRGSKLALWQANHIRERLERECEVSAEIVVIRTSGDRSQTAPLGEIGGKGVFVKEIEDALLAGKVDLAVHSSKDLPTETPAGLCFPAICVRDDVRDALISQSGAKLAELPRGARIGTGSLRRQAQLRHPWPDLQFVDMRGNVDTRLAKLERGDCDAIVLAKAGLDRLGWTSRITEVLSADVSLPAVGQGALAIEARESESEIVILLAKLDHAETRSAVFAERALLREVQGGCQIPLGAWARIENGQLVLDACIASLDGTKYIRKQVSGGAGEPKSLGMRAGRDLLAAGGAEILQLAGKTVAGR